MTQAAPADSNVRQGKRRVLSEACTTAVGVALTIAVCAVVVWLGV